MFGSCAKGHSLTGSDIDFALEGIEDELAAEEIAAELNDLPLPYRFDVKAMVAIQSQALREHIDRVGDIRWEEKGGPSAKLLGRFLSEVVFEKLRSNSAGEISYVECTGCISI